MKDKKNLKQAMSKRKGQILSMLKGIYGRVRYLERKGEFEKYEERNQRI